MCCWSRYSPTSNERRCLRVRSPEEVRAAFQFSPAELWNVITYASAGGNLKSGVTPKRYPLLLRTLHERPTSAAVSKPIFLSDHGRGVRSSAFHSTYSRLVRRGRHRVGCSYSMPPFPPLRKAAGTLGETLARA